MRHPDRRIWAIAGPAVVSNISAASIGLVDSWAIGHLPDPSDLAGLALGAYGIAMLLWSLGFLRMGTTGFVAQAVGAKAPVRLVRAVLRAMVLGLGLGLLIVTCKTGFSATILNLLGADGAPRMAGAQYLDIRLWAAPAYLLKMAVIGYLIGIQRTDIALYLEFGVNLVNVSLTIWFVTGLNLGVEGAALGSLIAECLAGLAACAIVAKSFGLRIVRGQVLRRRFWRWPPYLRLIKVNGFLFARTLLLVAAFGLFTAKSEDLGVLVLAANQILLNFLTLQALTLDALAYAAEALVGEAIGAQDRRRMRAWVMRSSVWALALSLVYILVFAITGGQLVALFTDQAKVRAAAAPLLIWVTVAPVICVWSFQFDGVFIGAAEARPMFTSIFFAVATMGLLIFLLMPSMGGDGLWIAFLSFFAVRGLGLALAYLPMERRVIPA